MTAPKYFHSPWKCSFR